MIDATRNLDRGLWMAAALLVYVALRRLGSWLYWRWVSSNLSGPRER